MPGWQSGHKTGKGWYPKKQGKGIGNKVSDLAMDQRYGEYPDQPSHSTWQKAKINE